MYTVQRPDPDVERPWWHDPDLDPDVLVLHEEESDPKDEALRWIGNVAERASFVVLAVWFASTDGWFDSGVAGTAEQTAGALVAGGACVAVGAVIKRRRPELFEDPDAAPSVGGW